MYSHLPQNQKAHPRIRIGQPSSPRICLLLWVAHNAFAAVERTHTAIRRDLGLRLTCRSKSISPEPDSPESSAPAFRMTIPRSPIACLCAPEPYDPIRLVA